MLPPQVNMGCLVLLLFHSGNEIKEEPKEQMYTVTDCFGKYHSLFSVIYLSIYIFSPLGVHGVYSRDNRECTSDFYTFYYMPFS